MQQIRDFGRVPKLVRGEGAFELVERNLAQKLLRMRLAGRVLRKHEDELAKFDSYVASEDLMQQIRDLGRVPRHPRLVKGEGEAEVAERSLFLKLKKLKSAGQLMAKHEDELVELASNAASEELMQQIRNLGRVPKARVQPK